MDRAVATVGRIIVLLKLQECGSGYLCREGLDGAYLCAGCLGFEFRSKKADPHDD